MTDLLDDPFDTFWALYPRRRESPVIEGKKKAREKLDAAIKSGVTWETIIAGVKAYAKCDRVRLGYVKMPVTWINNDCWEDEYEVPKSAEEILAAKPLKERTHEEWLSLLGPPSEFRTHYLKAHPELTAGAPEEILVEYGLEKNYG